MTLPVLTESSKVREPVLSVEKFMLKVMVLLLIGQEKLHAMIRELQGWTIEPSTFDMAHCMMGDNTNVCKIYHSF